MDKDDSIVSQSEKFLTFSLQKEFYGIPVSAILQIIAIPDITPIPKTPEFVKGVINLRGKIIPVIDLRIKFGLPAREFDDRTSIVIIRLLIDNKDVYIGIIVDTVHEVIDILNTQVEQSPSFGSKVNTDFIEGMAKLKTKVVILIDIEKVLTQEELVLLNAENN